MVNPVGFRFRPTDEEIFDNYLRPKNLGSNTSHVDEVISTVDITSFDPWELPSKSMIKSRDVVWYFFGIKKNKYNRGDRQRRTTKSGYWKKTGDSKPIFRKRGNRGEKIGEKRVLTFMNPDGSKSDWAMHEYHALSLSPSTDQMMKYTICKVEYKGEGTYDSSSSSSAGGDGGGETVNSLTPHMNSSEGISPITEGSSYTQGLQNPSQFSGVLDLDVLDRDFTDITSDDFKGLLDDDVEQSKIVYMQDDRNKHRPQKPLTGVISDHSSDDSDSDSISSANMASIETSSTCGSFGSSKHLIDQIETPGSTFKLESLTQEMSQSRGQEIEIQEQKSGLTKKKNAGFCKRMIQRLVKKINTCKFK